MNIPNELIYKPKADIEKDGLGSWFAAMDDNQKRLNELDEIAKNKNILVGRIITFPYADGQSIYQIIRENKNSVRLKVCFGLGDDWVDHILGEEGTINKDKAISRIEWRDKMNEFSSKQETANA